MDIKGNKPKWTGVMSNYVDKNDIKIPTNLKAIWALPTGDSEYFDGTLANVVYNSAEIM